jgi:hypothetical protein
MCGLGDRRADLIEDQRMARENDATSVSARIHSLLHDLEADGYVAAARDIREFAKSRELL